MLCRAVPCSAQRMSIDYCQSRFKNAPEPARCEAALRLYDQCGGKSNCTHSACLNAPWPGACCPKGTECKKQDAFFYQCLPIDHDMSVKGYKTPQVRRVIACVRVWKQPRAVKLRWRWNGLCML